MNATANEIVQELVTQHSKEYKRRLPQTIADELKYLALRIAANQYDRDEVMRKISKTNQEIHDIIERYEKQRMLLTAEGLIHE